VTVSNLPCPTTPRIELSLIRDFEARLDGVPLDIPPNSQRLVCFLAFQDRPVRRAYVSGTLWFNADESRASASLRSALWRLPPVPQGKLVCASHTHVWLGDGISVDVKEVMSRGMAVLDARAGEAELVDVARELIDFGDDMLVGWYDDWAIMQRECFRQVRLHTLDRIGERLIEGGRLCDALYVGLAGVRAEPLRESAHRLLVRVHLEEGNIAEALRQYHAYSALMQRELHSHPSPVMQHMIAPYLDCQVRTG
jgi:DNA-binding SARP family transcriptional activator